MNARNERILEASRATLDAVEKGEEGVSSVVGALEDVIENAVIARRDGGAGEIVVSVAFYPSEDDPISIDKPLTTSSDLMGESATIKRRTVSDRVNIAAGFVGGSVVEALKTSKEAVASGIDKGKSALDNKKLITGAAAAAVFAPVVVSSPAAANEAVNEIVVELDEAGGIVNKDAKELDDDNIVDDPQISVSFEGDENESAVSMNPISSSVELEEDNTTIQLAAAEEARDATNGGDTSVRGSEASVVTSDSQDSSSDDNGETIKVLFEDNDQVEQTPSTEMTESESLPTAQDSEETQTVSGESVEQDDYNSKEKVPQITPEEQVPSQVEVSATEPADTINSDDQATVLVTETGGAVTTDNVETPVNSESEPDVEVSEEERVVTVEKGDTLSEIALEHGKTTEELAELNGISDPNIIHDGDEVLISRPTHVVVQKGQTLSEIARAHNTTAKELGKLNDVFDINLILIGQKIILPGAVEKILIEDGQTLGALSIEYEVSVEEIVEVNGIENENLILAGQDLFIPSDQKTEPSIDIESDSTSVETAAEPEVAEDEELEVEPDTVNPDTYKPPAGLSEAETIDWFDKHISVSVDGLNNFSFDTSRQGVFEDETPHVDMPDIKGFLIHWTGSHYENGIDQFIGAIANREGNCCNVQFTIDDRAEPVVYMHALDHNDKMIHARNFNDHAPGVEIFATGLEDYSHKQLEQAIYTAFHSLNANGIEIQPGVLFAHSEVTSGKIDPPPELVDRMEEHLIRLNNEYMDAEKAASEEDVETEPVEEPEVVEETPAAEPTPVEAPEEKEEEEAPVEVVAAVNVTELEPAVIYEAQSTQSLINIGFSSLEIIPDKDKAKFDAVIGSIPTIQYSIENHNSREGDDWGPKIPATAALAIFHDLGLEGQDLLDAVTIVSGESGFAPYVIGDDKGERNNGLVTRMAVGLAQFFEYDEDGFDGGELAEKQVLFHPAVAMKQMVEWMERRGKKPWNFYNNRDEEGAWGGHYQRIVDAAQTIGFND